MPKTQEKIPAQFQTNAQSYVETDVDRLKRFANEKK